jgi:hypothetical protein
MKSFKSYLTEKQKVHNDMSLIFAGDVKLDMDNACKIWDDCGKNDTFRHITDEEGARFLINNKNKDVAVSAFKHSTYKSGIETRGGVITILDAKYTIWWPADAFTYIGSDGKRWIKTSNPAFDSIASPTKDISPQNLWGDVEISPFRKDYFSALYDLIMSNEKLINFVPSDIQYSAGVPIKDRNLFKSKDEFVNYFYTDRSIESYINEYVREHGVDKKFVKDALKLQRKYLDKHGDTIKGNLMKIWNSARTLGSKARDKFRHGGFDEAIVDNIKVKQLIFQADVFIALEMMNLKLHKLMNKLVDTKAKTGKALYKEYKMNMSELYNKAYEGSVSSYIMKMFLFIDQGHTKGLPFSFITHTGTFPLRESFKKHPLLWDYLKESGIVRDKSLFLRKKIMKSFKSYLTEKQAKRNDLYLVLRGDIKLDMDSSCKIWEDCGKRDEFRHLTDKAGAEFLIKNKNKNVTISALKLSHYVQKIVAQAEMILNIDADYDIWFPSDAFTYIGSDGKRWLALDTSISDEILGKDFKEDYLKRLYNMILDDPDLMKGGFFDIIGMGQDLHYINFIETITGGYGAYIDQPRVEAGLKQMIAGIKGDKFVKKVLKLQLEILDKHSDHIRRKLHNIWQSLHGKESFARAEFNRGDSFDEAVVSNIKVNHAYIKSAGIGGFLNFIERLYDTWFSNDKYKLVPERKKEIEDWMENWIGLNYKPSAIELSVQEVIDFAKNSKGTPFTFIYPDGTIRYMKKSLKDHKKAWDYVMKKLGWTYSKGVFLRKK